MTNEKNSEEKKKIEKTLIDEFFEFIKIPVLSIEMTESPDAFVKCRINGCERVIGFEITEYQYDQEEKGGSVWKKIDHRWDDILKKAQKKFIKNNPNAFSLDLHITINEKKIPPSKLYENLVECATEHYPEITEDGLEKGKWIKCNRYNLLDSYLDPYIAKLRLFNCPNKMHAWWHISNATMVGIVEPIIIKRVKTKTEKRKSYQKADECWLLMYASGSSRGDHAGTPIGKESLRSKEIREVARQSGYNRVYFWERSCKWYLDLIGE